MKSCKKCRHSKAFKQLGIVDWYCKYKREWIGFSADALFCRHYTTGITDEEIDRIADIVVRVIREYKKSK